MTVSLVDDQPELSTSSPADGSFLRILIGRQVKKAAVGEPSLDQPLVDIDQQT